MVNIDGDKVMFIYILEIPTEDNEARK